MPRLSIEVANAGGGRKRSASATGSDDSDFFDEGLEDLDEDLDKPWVTPSIEQAKNVRKVSLETSVTAWRCVHSWHAWPYSYDHRPSHPCNAGTERVGCSPSRQTVLAPSAEPSAVRCSASRMKGELQYAKNCLRGGLSCIQMTFAVQRGTGVRVCGIKSQSHIAGWK